MATTEKGIYYPNDYSEAADIPADMQTMAESVDTAIGNAEDSIGGQISTLEQTVQTNTQDISDIQTEQTTQNTNIQTNTNNVTALQTTVSYLEGLIPTDEASGEEITLTDSVRYPFKEFNVEGNTKQQSYTGANLYNVNNHGSNWSSDVVNVDEEGWISFTKTNGSSSSTYVNFNTGLMNLSTSTTYAIVLEIKEVSGSGNFTITSNAASEQFNDTISKSITTATPGTYIWTKTTKSSFENVTLGLRSYASVSANSQASAKFRISVIADTTVTADTFTYEPYVGGQASPNPNYPQEIENVSGGVEVKVENKNLCKNELINKDSPALSTLYESYTGPITIAVKTTSGTAQVNYRLVYEDGTVYNNYVMTANQANDVWRIAKYTAPKPIKRIGLYYISTGGTARVPEHIMFLKGTYNTITDADYEPHEEQTATLHLPEGMEMCKIGDYKDSFVYQGGKWYKNRVIKKRVLNGTEAWSSVAMAYTTGYYFTDSDIKANTGGAKLANALCSHLKQVTPDANWSSSAKAQNFAILQGSKIIRVAMGETVSNLTQFKNWLGENNITIECELATPVLEEITDTTLISDLNNLKNLYSYKGTTYISSSNEPSPVFEVVYRKSLG